MERPEKYKAFPPIIQSKMKAGIPKRVNIAYKTQFKNNIFYTFATNKQIFVLALKKLDSQTCIMYCI